MTIIIYYYRQESLRRNGIVIIVNKKEKKDQSKISTYTKKISQKLPHTSIYIPLTGPLIYDHTYLQM